MTDIKEIKLVDVKNNSNIINNLNIIYKNKPIIGAISVPYLSEL